MKKILTIKKIIYKITIINNKRRRKNMNARTVGTVERERVIVL